MLKVAPSDACSELLLICLPYSGGGETVFRGWSDRLPPAVAVCAAQLAGRGARFRESPHSAMEPLVSDLAAALEHRARRPYALFGHSLGALVAFELAHELSGRGCPPVWFFVSGCGAPHTRDPRPPIHRLPDEEFLAEIERLNGTPQAVLAERDLMRALMPMLRADFRVYETYACSGIRPLDCPISVFGGTADRRVSRERLDAWRPYTAASYSLRMLPGDHFFIHSRQSALLDAIGRDLAAAMARAEV